MDLKNTVNEDLSKNTPVCTAGSDAFQRFGKGGKISELFLTDVIRLITLSDTHKPQFLRQKYLTEGLSIRKIAGLTGVSKDAVHRALKRFNISKQGDEMS